jgi:hypothetical protein
VIRAIDEHFDGDSYSLGTLFRDEQRRILDAILRTTIEETEATYHMIFRGRAPLMRYLTDLHAKVPAVLRSTAQIVINAELRKSLSSSQLDPHHVGSLLEESARFDVVLDTEGLAHTFGQTIDRLARSVGDHLAERDDVFLTFDDQDEIGIQRITTLIEVAATLPFDVDLATAQDVLWRTLRELRDRAAAGEKVAAIWEEALTGVAQSLAIVPPSGTP